MIDWLLNYIPSIPSFVVGAVSGLLSVVVKYYLDEKQRRREYTTNLLTQLNSSQYLAPISFLSFKLAHNAVDFSTLHPDQAVAVEQTLDFLEFVAVCHRQKIIDTETLVRQEGGMIVGLFRAAQPLIERLRQEAKSDSIYCELQHLVPILEREGERIYGDLRRI